MKAKVLAAMVLVAAVGCKSGSTGSGGTGAESAHNLNGAGSTFVYPIYSKWFSEYAAAHPGTHINYQSIGSGGGIKQASDGTIDFGATDGPMSDAQIASAPVKLMHIPTVLGADVPVYNLAGVSKDLNFSPDVLADIYLGKITQWNDARLVKDNPGIALPAHGIEVVYRSDGSGTTYVFTDYLSKVSPEFATKVGKGTSVKFPVGIGQKGNEGVAGVVRNSPFSIGYVELIYALQNKMSYGTVKNADGAFVKATTDGVTAAAAGAVVPDDYRVSITNAKGATAYPISSFSWMLIPVQSKDPAKAQVLADFVGWMLDHGESETSSMGYAPLPQAIQDRVRQSIKQIR